MDLLRYLACAFLFLLVLTTFCQVGPPESMIYSQASFFVPSSDPLPLNITWTSYEHPNPVQLQNDTIIIGNRIQFNVTSNISGIPELEIANITIKLNDTGTFYNHTAIGNSANFSVPWLSYNYTAQIFITAVTLNGTIFSECFENVAILNTFTPVLLSVSISDDDALKTISWDVYDANIDDYLLASVLLSGDGGETYQLIASDLNTTSYIWDSTGFLQRNYVVLIRVTDSRGLQDEYESDNFQHPDIIPLATITFLGTSPIEILEGANDIWLQWSVENSGPGSYEILRDGVVVKQGEFSGSGVNYKVPQLSPGAYIFVARISSGYGSPESDPVTVIILKDYSMTITLIAIGITGGCIIGATVLFAMKRKTQS